MPVCRRARAPAPPPAPPFSTSRNCQEGTKTKSNMNRFCTLTHVRSRRSGKQEPNYRLIGSDLITGVLSHGVVHEKHYSPTRCRRAHGRRPSVIRSPPARIAYNLRLGLRLGNAMDREPAEATGLQEHFDIIDVGVAGHDVDPPWHLRTEAKELLVDTMVAMERRSAPGAAQGPIEVDEEGSGGEGRREVDDVGSVALMEAAEGTRPAIACEAAPVMGAPGGVATTLLSLATCATERAATRSAAPQLVLTTQADLVPKPYIGELGGAMSAGLRCAFGRSQGPRSRRVPYPRRPAK